VFFVVGFVSTAVFVFFLAYHLRRGSFQALESAPTNEVVRTPGTVFTTILLLMLTETLLESVLASWTSYGFEIRDGLSARDVSLALVLF